MILLNVMRASGNPPHFLATVLLTGGNPVLIYYVAQSTQANAPLEGQSDSTSFPFKSEDVIQPLLHLVCSYVSDPAVSDSIFWEISPLDMEISLTASVILPTSFPRKKNCRRGPAKVFNSGLKRFMAVARVLPTNLNLNS